MSVQPASVPLRTSVLAALACAAAGCGLLVELRIHLNGNAFYRFLDWNLFLAWVPLAFALGAVRCRSRWLRAMFGLLWLIFFPNAPYIVSDFIHLHPAPRIPLWLDGVMFASFAGTGLLVGFTSLYVMQRKWEREHGRVLSWLGVWGTLALTSVGLYLGRVLRFNSWDVVTHPLALARVLVLGVVGALRHPGLLVLLLGISAALLTGYVLLYGFSGLRLEASRKES